MPRKFEAGFLLTLSLLMAGCAGSGDGPEEGPADPETAVAVPDFSGPYAAEFAESYRSADSDFVRQALADEEISDAEYAEMTERFRTCLDEVGITFNGFNSDGSYSTSLAPNSDETHDLVSECVTSSGQDAIGMLRDIMAANPTNQDASTIMAECLVREGAAPPGYGADDYVADIEGRFADLDGLPTEVREALVTCSDDPLGIG
ncbi:hypothetical protein [Cellulomonas sp. KRMCY2]|uniref:hypothetical protein n=1 Tax=Cellulomonas sp. KRMCY2 TaxID=1304865 RepID=UPI00045E76D8|nr:hypothetical protein [Cellulomonas sp. KRMCY2]